MRKRIKMLIITLVIVREWIECGEFKDIGRIIVVGGKMYAVIINFLIRNLKLECCYCSLEDFKKFYKPRMYVKWIVFEDDLLDKKKMLERTFGKKDIIVFPIAYGE
mgnify:CR=1 FL=1